MLAKDILQEFVFECEIRKYSKRTIKGYRNNTALFLTFIENELQVKEVQNILSGHIKKYFQYLIKKGLTASYINGILKNLRAFFKYCIQEEYVTENPCKKVSWQKEGKVIINTFTDEEVIRIMNVYDYSDYLNARNKAILACLFDTGLRNLELCNLRHEDIKDNYIVIRHGKGDKERHIGISPLLKKHMIKYERLKEYYFKDKNLKHDNYFLSRTGLPLTVEGVERMMDIAGDSAKVRNEIRCSPHTCRHYFAQAQLRNGLDVYSLSRILGHENIMITKRYLQSLQDRDIVQMSIKTSPLMNLK